MIAQIKKLFRIIFLCSYMLRPCLGNFGSKHYFCSVEWRYLGEMFEYCKNYEPLKWVFYYKHGRTWLMIDVLWKRRKIRVSMSTDYRIQREKILRNFSRLLFALESRLIIRLQTSFLCHPPAPAFKFPLICSARLCNVIGFMRKYFLIVTVCSRASRKH